MAELKILNLRKEYEKGKTAVEDFTLTIPDGELAVIVGPSGCGKSTTLRMIAGLVPATSGRIILDGRDISKVSTRDRDIAMVFQNYALYENMTVFGNIAFPLKIRKEENEQIIEKVTGISKILKIEDLLDRRPKTLSGGEKQRVAMGRALVRNPKLFLMDEPLSNLDARLKTELREEIKRIQRKLGTTTIYVTHDQEEAMSIADTIIVMADGRIKQVGTPTGIYENPVDPSVAGFFGQPAMNIWSESGQTLGIRPEDIIISDYEKDGVPGIVNEQYYSGDRWIIKVETEKTLMTAFSPSPLQEKSKLWLKLPDDKLHRWEV